jgi:hypothetical protein
LAILLQPEDESIIVFADEQCAIHYGHDVSLDFKSTAAVRYSKYTYAGQCILESRITLRNLAAGYFHKLNNQLTPIDRRGSFRFSMAGDGCNICLQFDEQLNKFTVLRHYIDEDRMWDNASLFWWKDTFLKAVKPPDISNTATHPILTHMGTM